MPRSKRKSPIIDNAQKRADGLRSVDAKMVLDKLSLKGFDDIIADGRAKLSKYNELLSGTDGALNELNAAERGVADLSERMLSAVAGKFGKNSDEYEKAGGVKKSEKKKPRRKPKA